MEGVGRRLTPGHRQPDPVTPIWRPIWPTGSDAICVLLFPSGFQANIAAVSALANRRSTVLADRLIHHSLLVGVRASGARLQRFQHNDMGDLERRLRDIGSDAGIGGDQREPVQHGRHESRCGGAARCASALGRIF